MIVAGLYYTGAQADTGWEAATRREEGSRFAERAISVTGTATVIAAASKARPNETCRLNDTDTMFIGSSAVAINTGFPIISSETFKTSNTGDLYGICTTSLCEVRCIDGMTP